MWIRTNREFWAKINYFNLIFSCKLQFLLGFFFFGLFWPLSGKAALECSALHYWCKSEASVGLDLSHLVSLKNDYFYRIEKLCKSWVVLPTFLKFCCDLKECNRSEILRTETFLKEKFQGSVVQTKFYKTLGQNS